MQLQLVLGIKCYSRVEGLSRTRCPQQVPVITLSSDQNDDAACLLSNTRLAIAWGNLLSRAERSERLIVSVSLVRGRR
jgi:hypothetical protein